MDAQVRVEPHNLLRQNFYEADVGRFKSPRPSPTGGPGPTGVP